MVLFIVIENRFTNQSARARANTDQDSSEICRVYIFSRPEENQTERNDYNYESDFGHLFSGPDFKPEPEVKAEQGSKSDPDEAM